MSMEANPVDIHRATDAVLVQLDALAESKPNLLFIATSNFPQAVDDAFTSRCDLVMTVPLPDAKGCAAILEDCLTGLSNTYPAIRKLVASGQFAKAAGACVGLDGRTIRKMVVSAMTREQKTALNPELLTIGDIVAAAQDAKANRKGQHK